jgi:hypothetical protein
MHKRHLDTRTPRHQNTKTKKTTPQDGFFILGHYYSVFISGVANSMAAIR